VITRAQSKLIRRFKLRKRRDEEDAFLAEGVRLVEDLMASGWGIDLVVTAPSLADTSRGRELLQRVRESELPHAQSSDRQLAELAATETPQGVLALARHPGRRLADFGPGAGDAILVFDRLADPGNLGTLVRAAEALGVAWAVATPGTVDPWNPKTVRASAGSLFRLPVSGEAWSEAVIWLREHEFAIFGADPAGEPVKRGDERRGRFALVLGNEPSGLSDEVRSDCDRLVAVELTGSMDSLNVAVAGALLLDRLMAHPE
jgi:TrmH family RNA methyltransferase